ncbi:hypothetical protein FRB95_004295 [Tulasnella sp. JGI-2019a]|nr:hypothetical protein FRB95_004295 [Tulasnella sp. JGI-2019a]
MAEHTIGMEQLFKPSQHDLTEAYGTLGSRLRAHFRNAGEVELTSDMPALTPLKDHADELAKAFVRDLGRPTADPGPLDSSDESLTDVSSLSADEPAQDEPSSSPVAAAKKPKKKGVSAAQITYARDAFMLTQAAIRTVATILSSPFLHGCFSDSSLSTILQTLLSIPLAPKLYTPNARKTTMLAMWCLQNQRLSEAALRPQVTEFVEALARAIKGELGKEGKKGAASEALLAVQVMFRDRPALFIPHASTLLVPILERCLPNPNNSSLHLRSRGPLALGGIAMGILDWRGSPPEITEEVKDVMARVLKAWFDVPSPSPRKAKKGLAVPPVAQHPSEDLADTLLNALSTLSPAGTDAASTTVDSPQWAFTLLTSLAVILGPKLFECPGAWGMMCQAVSVASKKGTGTAAQLQTMKNATKVWWSSIIWCASQLDGGDGDHGVWKIVESVRGAAVCPAVAGRHIRMGSGGVKRAVKYIGETIREGQQAGIHVLAKLLGISAASSPPSTPNPADNTSGEAAAAAAWDRDRMVSRAFLDGSLLNTASGALGAFVKDVVEGDECSMIGWQDVRTLDLEEIRALFSELAGVWEDMINRVKFVHSDGSGTWEPPKVVLEIWEALVKAVDVEAEDGAMLEVLKGGITAFLVPAEDNIVEGRSAKGTPQKAPYPRGVPGPPARPSGLTSRRGSSSTVSSVAYTVDYEEEEEAESVRAVAALSFSRQVWDAVRNHLPSNNVNALGDIATTLLTGSLFDPSAFPLLPTSTPSSSFTQSTLFGVWSDFVVDTLVNCPLSTVEDVASRLGWDSEEEESVSRRLWAVWCRRLEGESGLEWRDGMMVLCVPLGGEDSAETGNEVPPVSMRPHELDLWNGLFERVVESANATGEVGEVVDHVSTLLGACGPIEVLTSLKAWAAVVQGISSFPSLICSTLSPENHLESTASSSQCVALSLPSQFFTALNSISLVLSCIPPNALTFAEDLDSGVELLNTLGGLLKRLRDVGLGEAGLVAVLKTLEEGLCLWFRAPAEEGAEWAAEQYNRLIIPLYITVLDVLQTSNHGTGSQIPPSWDTLHTLQALIASPIDGAPPPSLAIQAFATFFYANYHAGDRASQAGPFEYPEMLKPALRALRVQFEEQIASAVQGLSSGSSFEESHATPMPQGAQDVSVVSGAGYEADVSAIRWSLALNPDTEVEAPEPESAVSVVGGVEITGSGREDVGSGLDGASLGLTQEDSVNQNPAPQTLAPEATDKIDIMIPFCVPAQEVLVSDTEPRAPSPRLAPAHNLVPNHEAPSPLELETVLIPATSEAGSDNNLDLVVPDSEPERALLAALVDAASRKYSAGLESPVRAASPAATAPVAPVEYDPTVPVALMDAFFDFSQYDKGVPAPDINNRQSANADTAFLVAAASDETEIGAGSPSVLPPPEMRGRASTMAPTDQRARSRSVSNSKSELVASRIQTPPEDDGDVLVPDSQPVTEIAATDDEEEDEDAKLVESSLVMDWDDEGVTITPHKRKQNMPTIQSQKEPRDQSFIVNRSEPYSPEPVLRGANPTATTERNYQFSGSYPTPLLHRLIESIQPRIQNNCEEIVPASDSSDSQPSRSPSPSFPLRPVTPTKIAKKPIAGPSVPRPAPKKLILDVLVPTLKEFYATSRPKSATVLPSSAKKMSAPVLRRQLDVFDDQPFDTRTLPSPPRKRFVGPTCRDPAHRAKAHKTTKARARDAHQPSPRKRRAISPLMDQSSELASTSPHQHLPVHALHVDDNEREPPTPADTSSNLGSDDAPIGFAGALMSSTLKRKARDDDGDDDGDTEPNVSPIRGYVDRRQQRSSLTRSKSVGAAHTSRSSPPRTRSTFRASTATQFQTALTDLIRAKTGASTLGQDELIKADAQLREVQNELEQLLGISVVSDVKDRSSRRK